MCVVQNRSQAQFYFAVYRTWGSTVTVAVWKAWGLHRVVEEHAALWRVERVVACRVCITLWCVGGNTISV